MHFEAEYVVPIAIASAVQLGALAALVKFLSYRLTKVEDKLEGIVGEIAELDKEQTISSMRIDNLCAEQGKKNA